MDYKIFFQRIITSISLITLCYLIIIFFQNYLSYFIMLVYLIIFFEIIINFNKYRMIISIYIFLSYICINYYLINYFQLHIFLFTLLIIIFFDSFSYLFGSLFGKKKIFLTISPNKTYFGFFSGLILTFLLFFSLKFYFFEKENLFVYNFFIILIILFSFFGDIIESKFKRISNVKHSSNLLPGHGGFFDRLDSFILVAFIFPIIGKFL